ncbi:sugar-transfer associated ATP-grasp domain-containing protein [Thauera propionica]|uniref:sugar-transfer associated ATP-grasp domain-containing protein n=1 Tax=Thauera propionica TaxID=2019431 RepID=UPI0023F28388|nr:sugar-transfer associated ATP-grasp domain-containing protein [Thauera propionica]MDD3674116.1 sugar-transfer associated ATP-grasp domain-containing protein [Thauera propionica]
MKSTPSRIIEQSRLLFSSAICAEDYYHLGLFSDCRSLSKKRTFLGSFEKWRYYNAINPPVYDIIARDKALFQLMADAMEIPAPCTLATTAPGRKPHYGERLDSLEAVRDFLLGGRFEDLFFKPADGSLGEGALSLGHFEATTRSWALLPDQTQLDIDALLNRLTVNGQLGRFLIQRRLRPHPALAGIVPNVCPTVRLMTLCTERGVENLGAALRIGSGKGPTDNIAGGGLVVPIELESGQMKTAISLDHDVPQPLTQHPMTGAPIESTIIPNWADTLQLVNRCATQISYLPCIGWDIGITDEGPIIIEINTRPRCISVQSNRDSGLLDGPLGQELAKQSGLLKCGLRIEQHV